MIGHNGYKMADMVEAVAMDMVEASKSKPLIREED